MKYITTLAGALLGLLFMSAGLMVLLKLVDAPPPPEGTPAGHFMAAFATTGYLTFIKVMEVLGGLLVAIPRTRRLGLLLLVPIIVNILAFHTFVTAGEGLLNPMLVAICLLAAYLLWVERRILASFWR